MRRYAAHTRCQGNRSMRLGIPILQTAATAVARLSDLSLCLRWPVLAGTYPPPLPPPQQNHIFGC